LIAIQINDYGLIATGSRLVSSWRRGKMSGRKRSLSGRRDIYTAAARKPLANFRLALEAPDVPDFSSGIMGFDLRLALCDTIKFEGNPRFAHEPHYADLWHRR
jgi:hypothetical protein